MTVPRNAHANTFYGFMDRFLISRGHKLPYEKIGECGFWENVQDRVIGEAIGPEWKFDTLVVDEGQDFEPQWSKILRLFLKPNSDLLWLEDLDQSIRPDRADNTSESASERLAPNFIGFHTRATVRRKRLRANRGWAGWSTDANRQLIDEELTEVVRDGGLGGERDD